MTSDIASSGRRPRLPWLSVLLVFILGATLWAQVGPPASTLDPAATATPAVQATGELPSFLTLFNTSPIINTIIALLSVLAVALFVSFMLTINTPRMLPADFVDDVTKLVVVKKYAEAAEYCRNNRGIFAASIIQRCVENPGKDHSTLLNIIDAEGRRRADIVWNRISLLVDLSNVAPMLGLLGTVLGMVKAFYTPGGPTTGQGIRSKLLMEAIAGAMTATFFGLVVAILAVVFYTIIKGRATRTLGEVEQVVHSIADHMKRGAE